MVHVRKLSRADLPRLLTTPGGAGWDGSPEKWNRSLEEQRGGQRVVLLAACPDGVRGYGSLNWNSGYPPFRGSAIPEINDLVVAAFCRRQGIGSLLIRKLEEVARAAGCPRIGIGVGLHGDYGAVQRLYVRLGYVPDGHGMTWRGAPVAAGADVRADDDLALWLAKEL